MWFKQLLSNNSFCRTNHHYRFFNMKYLFKNIDGLEKHKEDVRQFDFWILVQEKILYAPVSTSVTFGIIPFCSLFFSKTSLS